MKYHTHELHCQLSLASFIRKRPALLREFPETKHKARNYKIFAALQY